MKATHSIALAFSLGLIAAGIPSSMAAPPLLKHLRLQIALRKAGF